MNFLCNTCLFIAVRMLFERLFKLQKVQDKWWSNTKFVMYTSLSYAFRCCFYKATVVHLDPKLPLGPHLAQVCTRLSTPSEKAWEQLPGPYLLNRFIKLRKYIFQNYCILSPYCKKFWVYIKTNKFGFLQGKVFFI